jgi:very-short-patch-repair endonuclease
MGLNSKAALSIIAISYCRELRKRQTKAESILWNLIKNRQFHRLKFRRQHPFYYDVEGLESFFIADFYCEEKRLAIELDGSIHKYRLKEDAHRTEILKFLNVNVLRFSNDEIENNLDDVLKKISRAVEVKQ